MKGVPTQIGVYIREEVIPHGMAVKTAAEKLGVSRPALSNLLNGKASLSVQMASRLEKSFGSNAKKLLELQASLSAGPGDKETRVLAVGTYVPSFLEIKARQIEEWAATDIDARKLLSVLMRKLVNSTGIELREVDFPGFDNSQRKGWDGRVVSDAATPWICEGVSGWEFGTNQNPKSKAESDYKARLASVDQAERKETNFVFVTPRNWPGKTDWSQQKNATNEWKSVRAFDASDLEQWLEESIAAQIWLGEQLGLAVEGFETLDESWHRWSIASEPPISAAMFASSCEETVGRINAWMNEPPNRPFVICADSKDEALAFTACLFRDSDLPCHPYDLSVVFDSPKTLRLLANSSSPFIPIVCNDQTERELASMYRKFHCIVVRPRNSVESEPDIALGQLSSDAFSKALEAMGFSGDDLDRLARESGRSPTILRRQLSKIGRIRVPYWADQIETARNLIPMAFVGAWHAHSASDQEVLSVLADKSYAEVERNLAQLLPLDDSPVWSTGDHRGVASKIDALFAIQKYVTGKEIEDFLEIAEYVLSETDPALELPLKDRWAAGLYGKVRNHSAALRSGICESLVILSVHGDSLFFPRLGFRAHESVNLLVRRLLSPLTLDKLLTHDYDLPRYAEAAPEEFLRIVEEDIAQLHPEVVRLLEPVDAGTLGGCPRSGLLWALECIAWNPKYLGRVSAILAQLSRIKIDDNWSNKPTGSLDCIFRAWMPQTAASLSERIDVLDTLTKSFPDIVWGLCLKQFKPGSHVGHFNYRPRWRSDAAGAGQVVTRSENYAFVRKALDTALEWGNHNESTLGDLVECLEAMEQGDQSKVWDLIELWLNSGPSEYARAGLRERIRRFAFTRRGKNRALNEALLGRARHTYLQLESSDPVVKYGWLFANQWIEESADELQEDEHDFEARDRRIHEMRQSALHEIESHSGFDGVSRLLIDTGAPNLIGHYAGLTRQEVEPAVRFVVNCLDEKDVRNNADRCIAGFLNVLEPGLLQEVVRSFADEEMVFSRLILLAPFRSETWRILDDCDQQIRDGYWKEVVPTWDRHSEAELTELLDCLLRVGRPIAAFHSVRMDWEKIETTRLKRLMTDVGTSAEGVGNYRITPYDISAALDSLDGRAEVNKDEMAQLEFIYLRALDQTEHGIPNLETRIAENPDIFVQAVAMAFKRSDTAEDPPELRIDDPGARSSAAERAWHLLDQISRIPGSENETQIDANKLTDWIIEARRLCALHARTDVGDQMIGQLLSRAPVDESGQWPGVSVCDALERIASSEIAKGFEVGVFNNRGVHWRGDGGDQERELAARYRSWADHARYRFPYVGGMLERIAESYERDARREDSQAGVRARLQD